MSTPKNPIFTLEVEGRTITYEFDHWDLSLDDYYDAFRTLMVGATFFESAIIDFIIEKGEELKELKEYERRDNSVD